MGQCEVTTQQVATSRGEGEQANHDKRKPNKHPPFEHGAGEVISQPVKNLHISIIQSFSVQFLKLFDAPEGDAV